MSLKSDKLRSLIHEKRLFLDGGMGTVLLSMLPEGVGFEDVTLQRPEIITSVHRAYLEAGSDIITSNTFSVNLDKYDDYEERVKIAMYAAKNAASDFEKNSDRDVFIAFDIGPTGRLMKPMGDMSFEEALRIFGENVRLAVKYGADLILIETMTDITELKAAVTASKMFSDLPIFATCAFSENGRLLTGASVKDVVFELEAMGVDALGTNCSFGPDKMLPVVNEFIRYASIPTIVSPNAGLPEIKDGIAVYNITPAEFALQMTAVAKTGAHILGGCCGTTPEYISELVSATENMPYFYPEKKSADESAYGKSESDIPSEEAPPEDTAKNTPLVDAILGGEDEEAVRIAGELLKTSSALDIINNEVIPVLNRVGNDFASGELFLPELMMCAETATAVFGRLKEDMKKEDEAESREIILATVRGDIHDIGKDIAKVLLESYGFKVYDLGIDVPANKIIEKINETGCRLVGLSVLMTTTVPSLEETVKELRERVSDVSIIAGGAVLTAELCNELNADYYAPDAMSTVTHALEFYE